MNTPQEPRRIALITGDNKGIGLETARQLARRFEGFTVLLGARRDEKRGTDAANQLGLSRDTCNSVPLRS